MYLAGEWVNAWLFMSVTFLIAALGVAGLGWWVLRGAAAARLPRHQQPGGPPVGRGARARHRRQPRLERRIRRRPAHPASHPQGTPPYLDRLDRRSRPLCHRGAGHVLVPWPHLLAR